MEEDGAIMRMYHWLERAIAAVILLGMVVVVLLATWSFFATLWMLTLTEGGSLEYGQFQILFDRVLAAVIALELAHSIRQMVAGDHGLGQLRTVIVIGMLAVVRKLIVLEVDQATGPFLLGIAAAVLALAVGLVGIRWVEDRRMMLKVEDRPLD
ncbi:Phosphate-starvation-inducible E [Rhodobacteraceae bacterium THAF1]|uniref:phosphate-starvation-inducible PsiE family protein n=1 Tax=Palleronia sp. THAF1 TaxID=2587842 RepID=UPI000F3C142A|nr:phosphate-starvation-inducible PsiE family protein [Palleronia sp. THAF1]QFU09380.1 Phosphate-starvation-inducible E [Palleronia sp. THAF1]VDC22025.1 Phosphate-starvation-inducible E [Rhodobacteraceae bacterium THAF1]